MLMRLCDVYNIPLATNPGAAIRFVQSLKLEFYEEGQHD
jgi:methylglyoxal synthase